MNPAPQPGWLGSAPRRVFSVLHRPAGAPRGGVLICPPLLHEYARSHRLFALLADALAGHGVAVLRFDYYGTGDADGEDAEFTLDGAAADAESALVALRSTLDRVPLAVLGVRAAAILAARCALAGGSDALWLWQPLASGATCLADLERRDGELRALHGCAPRADDDRSLVGFACHPALRAQLQAARLPAGLGDGALPLCVLDGAGRLGPIAGAPSIELAPPLHEWIDQAGMRRVPRPPLQAIGALLAARLTTVAPAAHAASALAVPDVGELRHG